MPALCPRCHGDEEIFSNPGYPDPQTETSHTCPECKGSGMNRDFVQYEETYTDMVLRVRDEVRASHGFDEAFDELLARQDRLDEYAPQVSMVPQAKGTVIKGSPSLEAAGSPDLSERKAA